MITSILSPNGFAKSNTENKRLHISQSNGSLSSIITYQMTEFLLLLAALVAFFIIKTSLYES